jgi:hypothetical protein
MTKNKVQIPLPIADSSLSVAKKNIHPANLVLVFSE